MVTTEQLLEQINFWIEYLTPAQRLRFSEWMQSHTRALHAEISSPLHHDRLNGQFRNWLETMPPDRQIRECLTVLCEVCWQGLRC